MSPTVLLDRKRLELEKTRAPKKPVDKTRQVKPTQKRAGRDKPGASKG